MTMNSGNKPLRPQCLYFSQLETVTPRVLMLSYALASGKDSSDLLGTTWRFHMEAAFQPTNFKRVQERDQLKIQGHEEMKHNYVLKIPGSCGPRC